MDKQVSQVLALTRILSGELFKALGFSTDGAISKIFSPLVQKSISRFSEIAVGFDYQVESNGIQAASQWFLPNFIRGMEVEHPQEIPQIGPLIIASNHPGAYDALVITANIPRDDIKIVVNIPLSFINELPSIKEHFLYASFDPFIRMNVVRNAIRHLKSGGALLLFASGGIDPDPATMPGSQEEINSWSRSLEIFLRRVPQTNILLSMISGILETRFLSHPLTIFRKARRDKQRVSEFLQIMHQMLQPGKLLQTPNVSFALPWGVNPPMWNANPLEHITQQAKHLLKEHQIRFKLEEENYLGGTDNFSQ